MSNKNYSQLVTCVKTMSNFKKLQSNLLLPIIINVYNLYLLQLEIKLFKGKNLYVYF